MPGRKGEGMFDDEADEAGFGLETKHFFERDSSVEDDEIPDVTLLNEVERLRFRPDIAVEGPAYAGIKRSRKAAFQDAGEDYFGEEVPKDEILFGNEDFFFNSDERSENVNEALQQEMQSLDKEYKELQKQEEIAPYRDNSVNKWHRKTQLSTGAAVMKSKLRAFNQSISQQIANLMRDPSRLIARMHLKRSSLHELGLPAEACQANRQIHQSLSEECDTKKVVDDVDPELFDDSEFYQQLLHEFLESSDLAALGGATRKLRNKKRKVVDRRASKGRKIRYNVHEKIVNFMVPEPISIPQMADKLFANLFGQKSVDTERT